MKTYAIKSIINRDEGDEGGKTNDQKSQAFCFQHKDPKSFVLRFKSHSSP